MKNEVVDFKNLEFEPIENTNSEGDSFPGFWDFSKNPIFTGKFIGPYVWNPENAKEPEWTALKFEDQEGFKFLLPSHFQIKKAVEGKTGKVFRLERLGEKEIGKGRTVVEYKIAGAK